MRSPLATTLVACGVSLSVATAGATEPEFAGLEDDDELEVTVRGAGGVDSGTLVSTVRRPQLARWGATSVATALENLPSVQGGVGSRGERLVTLRGFDQRQIAVFVDGIPVYVPYDGRLDLDKLPLGFVDRIVVIKGASSVLYGPNGLGGAIHVVTRSPGDALEVTTSTEGSPMGSARSSLVVGGPAGPLRGLVGVGFDVSTGAPMPSSFSPTATEDGGTRDNSDRLGGALAAKVQWQPTRSQRVTASYSRFQGRYGVPPGTRDFNVRRWRWSDWRAATLGITHGVRAGRFESEQIVYWSDLGNTLDSYDDGRYATQLKPRAFRSVYSDGSLGAIVSTRYDAPVAETRTLVVRTWAGLKHDWHEGQADLGEPIVSVTTNLLTAALQAELDVVPSWLAASAGLQLDGELPGSSPEGSPRPASGWGPMGSLVLAPAREIQIVAGLALRTRFPTLRERFSSSFGTRRASPALCPERALEASLDVTVVPVEGLRVAVGGFDAEVQDQIAAVVIAPQIDQLQNVTRGRLLGVEAELGWRLAPWLDATVGWMLLDARAGDSLEAPVAYRPAHKGLVTVTLSPVDGLDLTGLARVVGDQDFQNPDTGRWGRLGTYALLDARVAYTFLPGISAWLRLSNLADADVEPRYSFPEAGRQLFLGLGTRTGT